MVIGTGAAFAGLATLPCPLYYLEHPTLYDGKIVQAMELPQHYAGAIQGECLLTRWTTVDLIGASFGGWLVCAAKHNHAIPVSPTSTDTLRAPMSTSNARWFRSLCCRRIGLHSAQARFDLPHARSPSWIHRRRW